MNLIISRSYLEGLERGYLTEDPSKFNDPHVCDPYYGTSKAPGRMT